MKKNGRKVVFNIVISICFVVSSLIAAPLVYLSPREIVIDEAKTYLYVAEESAKQVAVYDLKSNKVCKTIALKTMPNGLVLNRAGTRLYVTSESHKGEIYCIDTKKGKVIKQYKAGHTPIAPVLSKDEKILMICNKFHDNVSFINVKSGKIISEIKVHRQPEDAVLSADGKKLYVANLLPAGRADGDFIASKVTIIDVETQKVVKEVTLPNGAITLRGICISPDQKFVYVTHILARYQVPTSQIERGWINTNAFTIITTKDDSYYASVLLDNVDMGAANPWDIKCTADGEKLCVTLAGTQEISIIELKKLHKKLSMIKRVKGKKGLLNVANDLSFLTGIRRRVKLIGNGPRSVCLDGNTAYCGMFFSDDICKVDLAKTIGKAVKPMSLGPKKPLNERRKGHMFFNEGEFCFQSWLSCASCHPDTRADALNWDLLNDGIGNPKQSRSMFLSHQTPPVMITGIRATAEVAVRAGLRYIQFSMRPEKDAVCIDEYLKTLVKVPSPLLVNGKFSKSAKRGEKVFTKTGCASCHPAPLYTDKKKHSLKMGRGLDKGVAFDTPALIEVWRSGPYMYDGRSATMENVVEVHNPWVKWGRSKKLTPQETKDLVEFIMSL